jgi:hypothetical protein
VSEIRVALYCPAWIYSSVCALVAKRYLSEEVTLEALSGKYGPELGKYFPEISEEMVLSTSEGYLRHLMEAEVDDAAEILESFAYNRLNFDANGSQRKIKGYFSSTLAGVKVPEVNAEALVKAFKPFIFMYRSKPELAVPAGWTWEHIEDGEWLKTFPNLEILFFDGL